MNTFVIRATANNMLVSNVTFYGDGRDCHVELTRKHNESMRFTNVDQACAFRRMLIDMGHSAINGGSYEVVVSSRLAAEAQA